MALSPRRSDGEDPGTCRDRRKNRSDTTMPYVTAFFMPRQAGDRPDAVPAGSVNFAFIGQFAESKERDCIFTTEYSVRVSMEAVYTLLNVDRACRKCSIRPTIFARCSPPPLV